MKEEAVRIRSSVLFLGALLGKIKKAVLPQPGGCAIGMRPIDLHLESLRQLGAVIEEENGGSWKENPNQDQRETQVSAQTGMLTADGTHMHGAHIRLRFPSVGATENIILAAVMLPGETIVEQAAREPEIDQLCEFLDLRGAKIKREKDLIRIKGGTAWTGALPDEGGPHCDRNISSGGSGIARDGDDPKFSAGAGCTVISA